jgi:hypothetical protein
MIAFIRYDHMCNVIFESDVHVSLKEQFILNKCQLIAAVYTQLMCNLQMLSNHWHYTASAFSVLFRHDEKFCFMDRPDVGISLYFCPNMRSQENSLRPHISLIPIYVTRQINEMMVAWQQKHKAQAYVLVAVAHVEEDFSVYYWTQRPKHRLNFLQRLLRMSHRTPNEQYQHIRIAGAASAILWFSTGYLRTFSASSIYAYVIGC